MKKVESDFIYRGYRCVTIFTDMGHRCGYVGLPEGHILYGEYANSPLKVKMKDIENQPLGKRGAWTLFRLPDSSKDYISASLYFDVHGGITYADGGKNSDHPIRSDLWWFGFDCGHYGDLPDYELLEMLWGNDRLVQNRLKDRIDFGDGEVRTLEYVMQECKNLVDQIIDLVEKYY